MKRVPTGCCRDSLVWRGDSDWACVQDFATADLSGMPVELRGAPGALPDPARGYAGGTLKFTKVLGALILP
eukprot:scaffold45669_cov62-Phaeocystis_antarctica.AAC.5